MDEERYPALKCGHPDWEEDVDELNRRLAN